MKIARAYQLAGKLRLHLYKSRIVCKTRNTRFAIFTKIATMSPEAVQQVFFNHIKSILPHHLSIVDEVASLLDISNDSAYRRMRGDKPLSFEEVQKLRPNFHSGTVDIFSR